MYPIFQVDAFTAGRFGGNPAAVVPLDAWLPDGTMRLADVLALNPDFRALKTIKARGFVCTAPGTQSDFVSRCFFPAFGIDEDPATGSAHTTLTPYWAEQLGKTTLSAIQLSERRGFLRCTLLGDRVLISGQGVLYLEGKIMTDK